MNIIKIREKSVELKKSVGGTIFSFPIDEENPLSHYAVSVFDGLDFKIYPAPLTIEEAAAGILEILEGFKSIGKDADYDRNVRLVSYDAQMNGPSVTMRRLRKAEEEYQTVLRTNDEDFIPSCDGFNITARGLIKLSYDLVKKEKNQKASEFMDEYYKILSSRKYGKTAAAIKQEVRKMDKVEITSWINKTYSKYINGDNEVFGILELVRKKSPTSRQED